MRACECHEKENIRIVKNILFCKRVLITVVPKEKSEDLRNDQCSCGMEPAVGFAVLKKVSLLQGKWESGIIEIIWGNV